MVPCDGLQQEGGLGQHPDYTTMSSASSTYTYQLCALPWPSSARYHGQAVRAALAVQQVAERLLEREEL